MYESYFTEVSSAVIVLLLLRPRDPNFQSKSIGECRPIKIFNTTQMENHPFNLLNGLFPRP
jgi:hypothetical protein